MPTTLPDLRAYLDRLVKVSDYATSQGISVTEVYRRIEAGKLDSEVIGGGKRPVQFVVLPDPAK